MPKMRWNCQESALVLPLSLRSSSSLSPQDTAELQLTAGKHFWSSISIWRENFLNSQLRSSNLSIIIDVELFAYGNAICKSRSNRLKFKVWTKLKRSDCVFDVHQPARWREADERKRWMPFFSLSAGTDFRLSRNTDHWESDWWPRSLAESAPEDERVCEQLGPTRFATKSVALIS